MGHDWYEDPLTPPSACGMSQRAPASQNSKKVPAGSSKLLSLPRGKSYSLVQGTKPSRGTSLTTPNSRALTLSQPCQKLLISTGPFMFLRALEEQRPFVIYLRSIEIARLPSMVTLARSVALACGNYRLLILRLPLSLDISTRMSTSYLYRPEKRGSSREGQRLLLACISASSPGQRNI